jgi:hypothetical protein
LTQHATALLLQGLIAMITENRRLNLRKADGVSSRNLDREDNASRFLVNMVHF